MASRALLLLRLRRSLRSSSLGACTPCSNGAWCPRIACQGRSSFMALSPSRMLPSSCASTALFLRQLSWGQVSNALAQTSGSQEKPVHNAQDGVGNVECVSGGSGVGELIVASGEGSRENHNQNDLSGSDRNENVLSGDFTYASDGSLTEATNVGTSWSSLVDAVIAGFDSVHNFTGLPWWLTIFGLSIVLRVLLLPLVILQLKKVVQILFVLPKLPFPVPLAGSGKSIQDQYHLFTKMRHELNCPNPVWFIATTCIQVPLFLLGMYSLRRMAFEKYPGFNCGGVLWFTDLTVPGNGSLAAVLPFVVAATYFANLQMSFKDVLFRKSITGTVFKFWKWWLDFCTIPIFAVGIYLPQAVYMYWVPNNMWNLFQNWLLGQLRTKFVHELQCRSEAAMPSSGQKAENLETYNMLLMEAAKNVAQNHLDKAIYLLKCAVKENSEHPEAYGCLGQLYLSQQQWSKAEEYYEHAISKGVVNEFLIAAYAGNGVALFNQGKISECIAALKAVRSFEIPQDPTLRFGYFRALVMLASALNHQGLKEQALEVLNEVAEYDSSVNQYIKELQQQIGRT